MRTFKALVATKLRKRMGIPARFADRVVTKLSGMIEASWDLAGRVDPDRVSDRIVEGIVSDFGTVDNPKG